MSQHCVCVLTTIYHLQVLNACIHPCEHLFPLQGCFWTRVQGCSEPEERVKKQRYGSVGQERFIELWKCWDDHLPLTDLLDSILQLVSLEENDEDRLVDLVTLWKHHTVRTETGSASD